MHRSATFRARPHPAGTAPTAALLLGALAAAACVGQPPGTTRPGEPVSLPSPAGAAAAEPNLFATPDGRAHLTWIEPAPDGHALRMATLSEEWSGPMTIAESPDMFVNWADFPALVETSDGTLWAHWLRRSGAGTYAYDVMVTRSDDGGHAWSSPISPHRDGTQTEHGFVSLVPGPGGGVTVVWLDGRRYAGVDLNTDGPPAGSMTVRAATLGDELSPTDGELLDERACDCCQTAAARVGDSLLVAYRDRSAEEVRDISVLARREEGWTGPVRVGTDGWKIPGCPVNGPSMAARGDRAAIAWFAMVEGAPEVKVAFTGDAGRSFDPTVIVERDGGGRDGHATLGRVDLEWIDDDTVVATWLTATGSDTAEIRFRTVAVDGTTGPARVLAHTHPNRASGFPRIARLPADLVAAWTLPGEGIELARIPLRAGG